MACTRINPASERQGSQRILAAYRAAAARMLDQCLALRGGQKHGGGKLTDLSRRQLGVVAGKIGEANKRLGLVRHGVLDVEAWRKVGHGGLQAASWSLDGSSFRPSSTAA